MDIYAERILPLFKGTGLSVQQLGKEMGIEPKIIYNWNQGLAKSYSKYLDRIAKYFGVSVDYLVGETDNPQPVAQATGENIQAAFFEGYGEGLTPEERDGLWRDAQDFARFKAAQLRKEKEQKK